MFVISQLNQTAANQRTGLQIKPYSRFQHAKPLKLRLRMAATLAQILLDENESAVLRRGNPLYRFSINQDEGRSEHLMPKHDPLQRTTQCCTVKIALQAQTHRNVIG